jgi:hypothetical protein
LSATARATRVAERRRDRPRADEADADRQQPRDRHRDRARVEQLVELRAQVAHRSERQQLPGAAGNLDEAHHLAVSHPIGEMPFRRGEDGLACLGVQLLARQRHAFGSVDRRMGGENTSGRVDDVHVSPGADAKLGGDPTPRLGESPVGGARQGADQIRGFAQSLGQVRPRLLLDDARGARVCRDAEEGQRGDDESDAAAEDLRGQRRALLDRSAAGDRRRQARQRAQVVLHQEVLQRGPQSRRGQPADHRDDQPFGRQVGEMTHLQRAEPVRGDRAEEHNQ